MTRTCLDCQQPAHWHGLCVGCRVRLVRHGLAVATVCGWPTVLEPPSPPPLRTAGVHGRTVCEDCDLPPMGGGRWCHTHYRMRVAA